MIKSLTIQNFQSHGKSKLEFHPGVNVIVGSSDSGKSAIIRAMRWIIYNRPSGDSIRSWWGGETSCEITVDGNGITRCRGKVDKYQIQVEGKNVQEFKAIGTSVPEEVSRLLNIDTINLQYQLDSPFLLSVSAGDVAKHFNAVARLDKIDTGMSNVNSAIRSLEQEIKYKEGQEKILQEGVSKYDHLEKFEAEVEVLEEKEKQFDTLWHRRSKLGGIILDYNMVKEDIERYAPLLVLEEQVNATLDLIKQRNALEEKANSLGNLMQNLFLVQDDIEDAQEYVKDEAQVNTVLGLYKTKNTLNLTFAGLRKLLLDLNYVDILLNKQTANLTLLQAKFKKEFPSICPLCGQEVKHGPNNRL